MNRWFEILILSLATTAGVIAVIVHRRSAASESERWSSRGSLLFSLAIVVGTLPTVFFPHVSWIRLTGGGVSLLLTVASLGLLYRQVRAQRGNSPV